MAKASVTLSVDIVSTAQNFVFIAHDVPSATHGLAAPRSDDHLYGSPALTAFSHPDIWNFRQGEVDE